MNEEEFLKLIEEHPEIIIMMQECMANLTSALMPIIDIISTIYKSFIDMVKEQFEKLYLEVFKNED